MLILEVLHMNYIHVQLSKFAHCVKDLDELFTASSKLKKEEDTRTTVTDRARPVYIAR